MTHVDFQAQKNAGLKGRRDVRTLPDGDILGAELVLRSRVQPRRQAITPPEVVQVATILRGKLRLS